MKTGELLIYEPIGAAFGGLTPRDVSEQLRMMGQVDQINVRINSPGGDVFDGYAIYRALRRHPAKVRVDVDGSAASIASVVAMAADPGRLVMSKNAWLMVHPPWSRLTGTADEFRRQADLLERIGGQIVTTYAERSGMSAAEVGELLAAGETWLSADEAVACRLADAVAPDLAIAAHVAGDWIRQAPDAIAARNAHLAAAKAARERLAAAH